MGRYRKYHTEEEQNEANRVKSTKYYLKNKKMIDEKRKRQYHEKKNRKTS